MIELVRYRTADAVRSALVKRGTKWMQVVAIDATSTGGLKVWKVPMSDGRFMTPLTRKGKLYPMARALRNFRNLAKTHGCSKAAKKLLKEATREDKANKNLGGESTAASTGSDA